MSRGEYFRFNPFNGHKYDRLYERGPDKLYVYNTMYRGRGTSWFKLLLAGVLGAYVAQNYNIIKIEGPFKMWERFKAYMSENRVKSLEHCSAHHPETVKAAENTTATTTTTDKPADK